MDPLFSQWQSGMTHVTGHVDAYDWSLFTFICETHIHTYIKNT